jgi:hypothetical protein
MLKEANLDWTPGLHDFFAIPDRGFDDKVFVISDVFVNVERLRGYPSATFQGGVEWALDHILISELIWLPTEAQLRGELEQRLKIKEQPGVRLTTAPGLYVCELREQGQWLRFEALDASEAYAGALLHMLVADQSPKEVIE